MPSQNHRRRLLGAATCVAAALIVFMPAAAGENVQSTQPSGPASKDAATRPTAAPPSAAGPRAPVSPESRTPPGLPDFRYVGRASDPVREGEMMAIVESQGASYLLRLGDTLLDFTVTSIGDDALGLKRETDGHVAHLPLARAAESGSADRDPSPSSTAPKAVAGPPIDPPARGDRRIDQPTEAPTAGREDRSSFGTALSPYGSTTTPNSFTRPNTAGPAAALPQRSAQPSAPNAAPAPAPLTPAVAPAGMETSSPGIAPTAAPGPAAAAAAAPAGMDITPAIDDPAVTNPVSAHDEPVQMEISEPGDITKIMLLEPPDPSVPPPGMEPAR